MIPSVECVVDRIRFGLGVIDQPVDGVDFLREVFGHVFGGDGPELDPSGVDRCGPIEAQPVLIIDGPCSCAIWILSSEQSQGVGAKSIHPAFPEVPGADVLVVEILAGSEFPVEKIEQGIFVVFGVPQHSL